MPIHHCPRCFTMLIYDRVPTHICNPPPDDVRPPREPNEQMRVFRKRVDDLCESLFAVHPYPREVIHEIVLGVLTRELVSIGIIFPMAAKSAAQQNVNIHDTFAYLWALASEKGDR